MDRISNTHTLTNPLWLQPWARLTKQSLIPDASAFAFVAGENFWVPPRQTFDRYGPLTAAEIDL